MKRREFVVLLGAGTIVRSISARAEQAALPLIGIIHSASAAADGYIVDAIRRGLKTADLVDGQNVAVEFHWAEGQYDRLSAMADDLVRRHAAVIFTGGGAAPARAAKAATRTIPIVFVSGDDPVQSGIVPSLNQPGGNVTGVVFFNGALAAKRVQLLHELLPSASVFGYLVNPNGPQAAQETKDVLTAAKKLGLTIHVLNASTQREIDETHAQLSQLHAGALLTQADPFLGSQRASIIALATRNALPVCGSTREYVKDGAVISYGTSIREAYGQACIYVARILKGESPSNLPVMQPTTFELSINLKAAKVLGLTVPPSLIARADEVIV
ncbi:MAG: ABC transporter substrate-binding protein [Xanthobacteraceae bacterium]